MQNKCLFIGFFECSGKCRKAEKTSLLSPQKAEVTGSNPVGCASLFNVVGFDRIEWALNLFTKCRAHISWISSRLCSSDVSYCLSFGCHGAYVLCQFLMVSDVLDLPIHMTTKTTDFFPVLLPFECHVGLIKCAKHQCEISRPWLFCFPRPASNLSQ
jgi:hypothetical protein